MLFHREMLLGQLQRQEIASDQVELPAQLAGINVGPLGPAGAGVQVQQAVELARGLQCGVGALAGGFSTQDVFPPSRLKAVLQTGYRRGASSQFSNPMMGRAKLKASRHWGVSARRKQS